MTKKKTKPVKAWALVHRGEEQVDVFWLCETRAVAKQRRDDLARSCLPRRKIVRVTITVDKQ